MRQVDKITAVGYPDRGLVQQAHLRKPGRRAENEHWCIFQL